MPVLVVLQSCSFCKLIIQIFLVWYQMRSCANASLCSGMLHRGPYLEGYFSALQKTNGRTQIIFCSTLFRNAPPSLLTWLGHRTIPLKFVLMEPNLTKSYYIHGMANNNWFHNYLIHTFNLASFLCFNQNWKIEIPNTFTRLRFVLVKQTCASYWI